MADKKEYKYQVMHVGVGKTFAEEYNALVELSETLDCSPAALVWVAIKEMLLSPPLVAPEGASGRTGSAAGFWVVPQIDDSGRATGLSVIEVESRSQVDGGQNFCRYERDDEKSHGRAERQAIKSAQHLATLLGMNPESITVQRLEGAATV